jgi:hypothetical protein
VPTPTPEEGARRWADNLSAATEKIRQGVQAVKRAPGAAAAAKRADWLRNIQASQEKWARNVARVGLAEWQHSMLEKGLNRIGPGAQASKDKMAAFASRFYPVAARVSEEVRAMPKGDIPQALARIERVIRTFKEWSQRGGA